MVVEEFTDSEGTVFESMFPLMHSCALRAPLGAAVVPEGATACYVSGPTPASSGCVVGSDRHTSEAAAEAVAFGGMRQSAGAADSLARARSTTALLGSRSRGGEGHASRVCCLEGACFEAYTNDSGSTELLAHRVSGSWRPVATGAHLSADDGKQWCMASS